MLYRLSVKLERAISEESEDNFRFDSIARSIEINIKDDPIYELRTVFADLAGDAIDSQNRDVL